MKIINGNKQLLSSISEDYFLNNFTFDDLKSNYSHINSTFHSYFTHDVKEQLENAEYHKIRYIELALRGFTGNVLDVGNDKPFLNFLIRKFNPESKFFTLSYEIPETPYDLYEVDVESEIFPFESSFFDSVIFTEVIEHLWRNPSHSVHQINRVLKLDGFVYLTTPNPCDVHSIVSVLWQSNPNQRSAYYSTLESGHLHLWTVAAIKDLIAIHGFEVIEATTKNLYGHTKFDNEIETFIEKISPYRNLMNETVTVTAVKKYDVSAPNYPLSIYPDGTPVLFRGAITSFEK